MVRIIGDIHGNWKEYLSIIKWQEDTIQVGDYWFVESHKQHIKHADATKHKILFWNHDDYRYLTQDYSLWDYWVHTLSDWKEVFFIRWAYSIDFYVRNEWIDWWRNEELTVEQGNDCVTMFWNNKPDIVISHDCPASINHLYLWEYSNKINTRTWQILDACFEAHQPSIRIHWHYHQRQANLIDWTWFISLGAYTKHTEADYIDLLTDRRKFKFRKSTKLHVY